MARPFVGDARLGGEQGIMTFGGSRGQHQLRWNVVARSRGSGAQWGAGRYAEVYEDA